MKNNGYKYGFTTDIERESFPKGLNKGIIELISKKREESDWLLDFRMKAYNHWKMMKHPDWQHLVFPPINYQDIYYYSAPKRKDQKESLAEVDEEIIKTFDRLGIPLQEQKRLAGVAIDAIFDSVSITTTHQEELASHGIIFCSISEAIRNHPELVKKYLGSVVPYKDNFYAALNSAVFTDGSFCYIPKGIRCPIELSTYFRINAAQSGQFERTLLIADQDSYVSYLEGCTACPSQKLIRGKLVEIHHRCCTAIKCHYPQVGSFEPDDFKAKSLIDIDSANRSVQIVRWL